MAAKPNTAARVGVAFWVLGVLMFLFVGGTFAAAAPLPPLLDAMARISVYGCLPTFLIGMALLIFSAFLNKNR